MRPPAKAYLRKIYKKFGFVPTWLPNQPVAPGDVGTLEDGRFQRFTDLESLGIKAKIREGSYRRQGRTRSSTGECWRGTRPCLRRSFRSWNKHLARRAPSWGR